MNLTSNEKTLYRKLAKRLRGKYQSVLDFHEKRTDEKYNTVSVLTNVFSGRNRNQPLIDSAVMFYRESVMDKDKKLKELEDLLKGR